MDAKKTGNLISEKRKERGLTQKHLADLLSVSDRAVSKWERGKGFPDVSLLTPLAEALNISIVDLIEGEVKEKYIEKNFEKTEIANNEGAVKKAVAAIKEYKKAKKKKSLSTIIATIFLTVFIIGMFYIMLEEAGVHMKKVQLEVPADIYQNGEVVGETPVVIDGRVNWITHEYFNGKFAIEYIEKSCRDSVQATISWNYFGDGYNEIMYWNYGEPLINEDELVDKIYISEDMHTFAMELPDGTVISTSQSLVPLVMLDYRYSVNIGSGTWLKH